MEEWQELGLSSGSTPHQPSDSEEVTSSLQASEASSVKWEHLRVGKGWPGLLSELR